MLAAVTTVQKAENKRENMYLLIHSLVLVLVAVMKPKELKTKISHANPLILSLPLYHLYLCLLL